MPGKPTPKRVMHYLPETPEIRGHPPLALLVQDSQHLGLVERIPRPTLASKLPAQLGGANPAGLFLSLPS